jgi:hypothetical protein
MCHGFLCLTFERRTPYLFFLSARQKKSSLSGRSLPSEFSKQTNRTTSPQGRGWGAPASVKFLDRSLSQQKKRNHQVTLSLCTTRSLPELLQKNRASPEPARSRKGTTEVEGLEPKVMARVFLGPPHRHGFIGASGTRPRRFGDELTIESVCTVSHVPNDTGLECRGGNGDVKSHVHP